MPRPARNQKRDTRHSVFQRLRRKELLRQAHTLAVTETERWGPTGCSQLPAWYRDDLRRGRRNIYGTLLRFIDLAVERGTPEDVLQQIPDLVRFYIADACLERDRLRRDMRLHVMSNS